MEDRTDRQRRILRESLIALLALSFLVPGICAKERRGAHLVVIKTDKSVVQGELLAVRGVSLIMVEESTSAEVSTSLKDVEKVSIWKGSKAGKGAAIGAVIGGLFGAGAGATTEPGGWLFETKAQAVVGLGAAGAGVGALLGIVIGAAAGRSETIAINPADPLSIGRAVNRLGQLARERR